jgi:sterol desaturase/sphingolipid hydroxylase (fatty acid hydroxylase superfamily)
LLGHRQRCRATAAADGAQELPKDSTSWRNPLLAWLPDARSLALIADAATLLLSNIWALLAIFLLKDAAAFLLHRVAHRITNHCK